MEEIEDLLLCIRFSEKLYASADRQNKANLQKMLAGYYQRLNKAVENAHNDFIFLTLGSGKHIEITFQES